MHGLGARLKELRKSRGWTQKQLGELIHKSKAAIGSYEQEVQTPPADVLISLAKLYHLSLDELVGLDQSNAFSVEGLTLAQRETIDMLLIEFGQPTGNGVELSEPQLKIINNLIRTFMMAGK